MAEDSGLALYRAQMGARKRAAYLAGSEDAPPFAALEIYGRTYTGGLLLRKPQSDDLGAQYVVFNGDQTWAAGTHGTVTNDLPCIALYSTPLLTLSNRIAVGTVADDWGLSRGYEGFLVIGKVLSDDEKCVVLPNNVCREPVTGRYYYNGSGVCECCRCCGCDRFTEIIIDEGADPPTSTSCWKYAIETLEATVSFPCIGTRTITLTRSGSVPVSDEPGAGSVTRSCSTGSAASSQPEYALFSGSFSEVGGPIATIMCDTCDPSEIISSGLLATESLTISIACLPCIPPGWTQEDPVEAEGYDPNNCRASGSVGGELVQPGGGLGCVVDIEYFQGGGTRQFPSRWEANIEWSKYDGLTCANVSYSGPVELISCNPISFTLTKTAICRSTDTVLNCERVLCSDPECTTTQFENCVGGDLQMDADETAEAALMGGSPFGGDGGIF